MDHTAEALAADGLLPRLELSPSMDEAIDQCVANGTNRFSQQTSPKKQRCEAFGTRVTNAKVTLGKSDLR